MTIEEMYDRYRFTRSSPRNLLFLFFYFPVGILKVAFSLIWKPFAT